MDTNTVVLIVVLVIVLVIAIGLVTTLRRRQGGTLTTEVKTPLGVSTSMSADNKQTAPHQQQIGGKENEQRAKKDAASSQTQFGGTQNKQKID